MSKLQQIINDVAGRGSMLSIQPGGNYGDYLISRGFDKIAKKSSAEKIPLADGNERFDRAPELPSENITDYSKWLTTHIKYIRSRLTIDASSVYIHGGGNFNDLWKGGVNCYKIAARYFSCPIIIGPQSCLFENTDPKTIFKDVENQTYFFCREKYSYNIMKSATADLDHVSVYLSKDTALYLDPSDLYFDDLSEDYSLIAMRADKETTKPLIEHNINKPVLVQDISVTADNFNDWVDLTARARTVYTDRLHVAILATILNKQVVWYEASYHKSRGVYEYSLSDQENIDFHYVW